MSFFDTIDQHREGRSRSRPLGVQSSGVKFAPLDLGPDFAKTAERIRSTWPLMDASQRRLTVRAMGLAYARACGLETVGVAASFGDIDSLAWILPAGDEFYQALKPR